MDTPRGNHAMLSAQPGPPTSQLRLAYRRPPHDPARESRCHETADRTPRAGNRTCKYLMAVSQVDRHSSEQQVGFICPCSEPMSASCTTDPARLRLDRSRVARGGRPCWLQVAPVRLLPPRGPSRASLLLSLLVSLAAGERSARECGLRGTPSSSSWPRLCAVLGSTSSSAASSSNCVCNSA